MDPLMARDVKMNSCEKDDKACKARVKYMLSLKDDYGLWEVLEAMLMNDLKKLDEMRDRCLQLHSAYKQFIEEFESGDEKRKKLAISGVTRPEK